MAARQDNGLQDNGFLRAGRWSKAFFSLFAKVDLADSPPVVGREGVVFAANHRSFFDIFLAYIVITGWGVSARMLVRGSYFKTPVLGWMLRATGCIPVQSGSGEDAIDSALEELRDGRCVAIMPEGRLVKAADRPSGVGEAREGVGVMALQSGAPVVAIGLAGAERVWPVGRPFPLPRLRRTNVTVRWRLVEQLSGTPAEARDTIMSAIAAAVHDAEAARL